MNETISATRTVTPPAGRSAPRKSGGWTRLQIATHVAALVPLAWLLWDAWNGDLTANPIQEVTFRTGRTALRLLVLSLAITPANTLFGWRRLIPLRRALGLYAFCYGFLHFLTFVVLDYGLDPVLLQEAILKKKYALVGFSAFLILLPLAITSTKGWQKRLGKRWKQIHKLAYLAAALVIVHFTWLVKADITRPIAYGIAVALLLTLRLPAVRQAVTRWRSAKSRRRPTISAATRRGESST